MTFKSLTPKQKSSLSAQIGKLRKEGILESEKSRFTLL